MSRLRSTEYGFERHHLKRGTGDRKGGVTEGCSLTDATQSRRLPASGARERDRRQGKRLSERGQAPSRERDEARPQQARLGWHAVPTLPEAGEAEGLHVVRSVPQETGGKGEPGTGKDARLKDAAQQARLGWHAVPTLPQDRRTRRSRSPTLSFSKATRGRRGAWRRRPCRRRGRLSYRRRIGKRSLSWRGRPPYVR